MKKICRTIKLGRYKSYMDDKTMQNLSGLEYIVCFDDNTYKWCLSKSELRECLEKDHIKGIRYVFDSLDRIVVMRDVLINTDEL